jgi:hypothetical protein
VLLIAMFACIGLLAVHRFQIVAIVVLAASAIVLVAWSKGFWRKFGRNGPLNDEDRRAAAVRLRGRVPRMPDLHDEHRRPTR